MIKEISQSQKLKKVTMAAAVVGMGIGLATMLTSFDSSGGGGSGSGCSTSSFLYTHHSTQDRALQVKCYSCTDIVLTSNAVLDTNHVVIGFNITYKRLEVTVTRRDCQYSSNENAQCNEISLTNADPSCTIFKPGTGSGAGL